MNNQQTHKLESNSKIYYEQSNMYNIFSQAEDYKGLVVDFLKPLILDKKLLDVGCGTGKYVSVLAPLVSEYICLDQSKTQLEIAKNKTNKDKVSYIQASAEKNGLNSNSVDVAIATWVLGSILDIDQQLAVLKETERVLKENGSIYVAENDGGCEFEEIIRREPNISTTKQTKDWLEEKGFVKVSSIDTYFEFNSLKDAQDVFYNIWGSEISKRVQSEKIAHKIAIYEKKVI